MPSGDIYKGAWHRGRKHGSGIFVFWDGARIEGEWADDQLRGTGVHISATGERSSRTYGHLTDAISKKSCERPASALPTAADVSHSRRPHSAVAAALSPTVTDRGACRIDAERRRTGRPQRQA